MVCTYGEQTYPIGLLNICILCISTKQKVNIGNIIRTEFADSCLYIGVSLFNINIYLVIL